MQPIHNSATSDRVIQFGPGLAAIPERLLLAHARGEVLFIAGAGISRQAGLPDFRGLVLKVYAKLDAAVYDVISGKKADVSRLTNQQAAEAKRYFSGDYDVVLGMLERRMDGQAYGKSSVRQTVANELRASNGRPAPIHKALMRLSDRGGAITIVTTNFELLLEDAAKKLRNTVQPYTLGGIPRPALSKDFNGVFHIGKYRPGENCDMRIPNAGSGSKKAGCVHAGDWRRIGPAYFLPGSGLGP